MIPVATGPVYLSRLHHAHWENTRMRRQHSLVIAQSSRARIIRTRTAESEHECFHGLVRPFPVFYLRHIIAVLARVLLVLHQFVAQELLEVGAGGVQLRNAVHCVTS